MFVISVIWSSTLYIYTLQNNLRLSECTCALYQKAPIFCHVWSLSVWSCYSLSRPWLFKKDRQSSWLQDNRFKEEKATATLDHGTLHALNVHQESIDNRIQSIVNTAKATASNQVFVDGVHFTVQFNPQARVDKCQFCDHENNGAFIQNDAREDSISISTLAPHEMALHRYYGDPTKTSSLNPRTSSFARLKNKQPHFTKMGKSQLLMLRKLLTLVKNWYKMTNGIKTHYQESNIQGHSQHPQSNMAAAILLTTLIASGAIAGVITSESSEDTDRQISCFASDHETKEADRMHAALEVVKATNEYFSLCLNKTPARLQALWTLPRWAAFQDVRMAQAAKRVNVLPKLVTNTTQKRLRWFISGLTGAGIKPTPSNITKFLHGTFLFKIEKTWALRLFVGSTPLAIYNINLKKFSRDCVAEFLSLGELFYFMRSTRSWTREVPGLRCCSWPLCASRSPFHLGWCVPWSRSL